MKIRVDLSRMQKRLSDLVSDVAAAVTLSESERLLRALVLATPIKTGYARSQWTLVPRVGERIPLGYNVSSTYLGIVESRYQVVNYAHYIIYLNRGSSKQAPAFFIENTIVSQGFKLGSKL